MLTSTKLERLIDAAEHSGPVIVVHANEKSTGNNDDSANFDRLYVTKCYPVRSIANGYEWYLYESENEKQLFCIDIADIHYVGYDLGPRPMAVYTAILL